MAKGIYVGVDKTHELSEFTSSRAPINWTNSGNGKTATATNSYGEWKITASQIQDATSYNTINAFDTSEYSFWNSGNLSSDTDFVWCGIYLPEGLSINPKKFSLRYDDFRNAHIQGLNEATEAWENIASLTDTSSMLSVTPAVTTTNYYKAFRIAGYRYSSTYKNPALDSFRITAGTMKIPNIKNNIARKVKKAYVGVNSKARKVKKGYIGVGGVAKLFYNPPTIFTSNPAPTGFSGGLTEGTDSNSWGTWTISADVQNSGYYPKDAFDGDTSTHFTASSIGTSTGTRSVTLNCPSGVYIKPSHIKFTGARLGTVTFTGVTESDARVTFGTKTGSSTSNETMNIYPTTDQWFKSFRVETTRYSSSYKQPWFTEFQIVSGEIRKD